MNAIINSASGGGGGVDVDDNGTPVASASTLNFIGATVEDAGGGQVDITVGGAGTPQLPAWTYSSGGTPVAAGSFITNDPAIQNATIFQFANDVAGGGLSIPAGSVMAVSDTAGNCFTFTAGATSTTGGTEWTILVTANGDYSSAGNWSGKYTVSFIPARQSATDVEAIPSGYLDTDGTLAANSDAKVASQKATKTYADTKVAQSDIGTTVLAPNGDGTGLSGIIKTSDIGTTVLAPNGDGTGLSGIIKTSDIGTTVLAPNGDGTGLSLSSNITYLAGNLTGTALPALDASALTGLSAANITPGGILPALDASALTGLTQTQILTALGIGANPAGFTAFLAIFGITPVSDGNVTPVTSATPTSGILTALS